MSGNRKSVQHNMQGVFVFVLLGLFAIMSTLMVLLGAQMYHNTVDHAARNNEDRILAAYVRSMVRANDCLDSVSIEQYGDIKALALREGADDTYVTWIYQYDGKLYEYYTGSGEFEGGMGEIVCDAVRFEPRLEDGELLVELEEAPEKEGESPRTSTVRVALRCAQQ